MEPSKEEWELIKKFRERLDDIEEKEFLHNDSLLIRFIRARDHNLDKAEEMCRNNLKWRKVHKIENTLNEIIPYELTMMFQCGFGGFDKKDRPVLTVPFGEWDIKKYVEGGYRDQMIRTVYQALEIARVTLDEGFKYGFPSPRKWPVMELTVLVDMKGYSLSQLTHKKTIEMTLELVKAYEANYPESLGKCIIVNAPWIFSTLFNLVKPFLSEKTIDKIAIFDSKKDLWKKAITECIDIDQLTERWGGKSKNEVWF